MINAIGQQSADIAMGTHEADEANQGAGDQGLMFGYASDETDVLMPHPFILASLGGETSRAGKSGAVPWLRPDAKSQITMRYGADGKPERVEAVVLSTQHSPDISQDELRAAVRTNIIEYAAQSGCMPTPCFISTRPVTCYWGLRVTAG